MKKFNAYWVDVGVQDFDASFHIFLPNETLMRITFICQTLLKRRQYDLEGKAKINVAG